jgi:hypothetical protein
VGVESGTDGQAGEESAEMKPHDCRRV